MSERPEGRGILRPSARDRAPWVISFCALITGAAAAFHYSAAGLALAHYDARAHLVVARRIIDSLTPGWQQVGAVWLPLPHLINMLPVQIDLLYRTGASAIAISVLSIAIATWAMSDVISRTTGSLAGAMTAAALLLLNPNVLYLQSTPMTEPLLFGTVMAAIALTARWLDEIGGSPRAAGIALAAACLTRYEAWPIAAAIVGGAVIISSRRGASIGTALRAGPEPPAPRRLTASATHGRGNREPAATHTESRLALLLHHEAETNAVAVGSLGPRAGRPPSRNRPEVLPCSTVDTP